MENWKASCHACQEIPTFCVASSPVYPNPLTILSNGSRFVYLLDFKEEKQLAVLKFPHLVVHVTMMNSLCAKDEQSDVVTCCLGQGQISAFSITHIVNIARKQLETNESTITASSPFGEDEDIFTTLFSDLGSLEPKSATSSRRDRTISASRVSVVIGTCPSRWALLSAVVINNDLVMCRRLHRTGEISLSPLQSHQIVEIPSAGKETLTVPSFVSAYNNMLTLIISTGSDVPVSSGSDPLDKVMDCKPTFSLIQSEKHSPKPSISCVDSKLFFRLFGPDYELSMASVLLIGCQNGNIYYTNFVTRTDRNAFLPLYSLEQPVIGIHLVYFPMNKTSVHDDPFNIITDEAIQHESSLQSGSPNVIIFVGQGGKIALCHVDNDGQTYPSFTEFHVPGPVISSIVFPNVCLLYSTSQSLYKICFRRECVDSVQRKLPTLCNQGKIQIPEISFRFPEKIYDSDSGIYLLPTQSASWCSKESPNYEDDLKCLCLSFEGQLATLQLKTHIDQEVSYKKNSTLVGHEIKMCLESIQTLDDKMDCVMKKITSFSAILSELKTVLDVLCSVEASSGTGSPFSFSFKTTHEKIGIGVKSLCIDMKLSYMMGEPLGDGWSLMVTSKSYNSGKVDSKFCVLTGMASGNSVTLRTAVGQLDCSINCFIHYNPQYLCKCLPKNSVFFNAVSCKSVSLFLCKRDFTILDFLQDKKDTRETLSSVKFRMMKSILSPEACGGDSSNQTTSLLHSVSLSIPLGTVVNIIQDSSCLSPEELQNASVEVLGIELLCVLVPAAARKPKSRNTVAKKDTNLYYSANDGSSVSFEVNRTEESNYNSTIMERCCNAVIKLVIRASSKKCIIQIVSGIRKKLTIRSGFSTVTYTHEHLSTRLVELKRLLQEVSNVQRELSSAHHERRNNSMTSDTYSKKLDSSQTRIISLLFKLQELWQL